MNSKTGTKGNPKETQPKFCLHCGKQIKKRKAANGEMESFAHHNARKFCNRRCMAKAFDLRHRGGIDPSCARRHARKLVGRGPCKKCGKPNARDVHHKDGNYLNNSRRNLQRLCRGCHIKEHRPAAKCKICGEKAKGHKLCRLHLRRFKRWGDPLVVGVNQYTQPKRR